MSPITSNAEELFNDDDAKLADIRLLSTSGKSAVCLVEQTTDRTIFGKIFKEEVQLFAAGNRPCVERLMGRVEADPLLEGRKIFGIIDRDFLQAPSSGRILVTDYYDVEAYALDFCSLEDHIDNLCDGRPDLDGIAWAVNMGDVADVAKTCCCQIGSARRAIIQDDSIIPKPSLSDPPLEQLFKKRCFSLNGEKLLEYMEVGSRTSESDEQLRAIVKRCLGISDTSEFLEVVRSHDLSRIIALMLKRGLNKSKAQADIIRPRNVEVTLRAAISPQLLIGTRLGGRLADFCPDLIREGLLTPN